MVLLSCSGTGGGIYAKLANGVAQYNCAQVSLTHNSSALRSLHVVNQRIITNALIERNRLSGSCFYSESLASDPLPEVISLLSATHDRSLSSICRK